MSVEPAQWLTKNAQALGYPVINVSAASVDLRLHGTLKFARKPSKLSQFLSWNVEPHWKEYHLYTGEHFTFKPGYFYLCSTVEYIKVPNTHCAFVQMRSSLARKGLGHKMAGFIDPGFEGQITLELETHLPVKVVNGERIVQIIYDRMTEKTTQPYVGKYHGQRGPTKAYTQ